MLSKIEDSKVSSPISVYAKIAKGLEIPWANFFRRWDDPVSLSRRRTKKMYSVHGLYGEAMPFKNPKKMEPFIIVYPQEELIRPTLMIARSSSLYSRPAKFRYDDLPLS